MWLWWPPELERARARCSPSFHWRAVRTIPRQDYLSSWKKPSQLDPNLWISGGGEGRELMPTGNFCQAGSPNQSLFHLGTAPSGPLQLPGSCLTLQMKDNRNKATEPGVRGSGQHRNGNQQGAGAGRGEVPGISLSGQALKKFPPGPHPLQIGFAVLPRRGHLDLLSHDQAPGLC